MHLVEVHGRLYAQFERLRQEAGLVHAFSTRPMNVAPHSREEGASQRRWMVQDWGLDPAALHYCQQVHRTGIALLEEPTPGGPLPRTDAVATKVLDLPLMTFSADCPLVLLYDPVERIVGLVHASWRCTVARLTARLITLLSSRFGCRPAHLRAGIGPGAGPCCYEVQDDVYAAAGELDERERFFVRREGRLYFDLWEANRAQLLAAGVRAENIELAGICTLCRPELFYSLRREGRNCGHFGLLAACRGV
jgi:YfiH family protein